MIFGRGKNRIIIGDAALRANPGLREKVRKAEKGTRKRDGEPTVLTRATVEPGRITLTMEGLVVLSETNQHDGWLPQWKRTKAQKEVTHMALSPVPREIAGEGPWTVTFTRHGQAVVDEGDNLGTAFKWIRDTVAKWLGTDDKPTSPVTWQYAQKEGPWSALVVIEWSKDRKDGASGAG